MHRYTFYILIALLTFAVGSSIAFKFLWETKEPETVQNNVSPNMGNYYNFNAKKEVQFLPKVSQEKNETIQPFCRDKRILPVWKLLLKDKYFRDQRVNSFQVPNCADMFEVLYFDLNQDGKNEILLRGKSPDLCGAVGNCGFWVFEKKDKKYRKILTSSDYVDITQMGRQIRKNKTKGYFNILLKGHINAADTHYVYYKFDGQRYKQGKCLVNTYIRNSSNDNPKWEFISCKEYEQWEQ